MKQETISITYELPRKFPINRKKDVSFVSKLLKDVRSVFSQLKLYFGKGPVRRTRKLVEDAYNNNYSISNTEWYRNVQTAILRKDGSDIIFGNGLIYLSAHTQIRSNLLNQLHCTSVLDIGMGRGDNLIALASFNPNLEELAGLELTEEGYKHALEWKEDVKKINFELIGLGEDTKKIDFNRIRFLHGSGTEIPLPDKSFDASYTHLVLEQVPRDYPHVLREMRRVTRKYCFFLESFAESLSLADKIDLKNRDYFRFSYREFEKYGLQPIHFTTKFIKKNKFGTGLLVAKVL